ncbi:glycosyl hydrolase family protein [Dankookia rubra]|uniref:Glycosyl hydrolase family protein n=1 Tax=Dankookia rubra TaxID=1442381 RepID=A0A4R5Q7P2_9PROT|nr:glycosyl hydrolase family protein [Dankookia rubra]
MIGTRALADFYESFDSGVGALHHTWNSDNIQTGGGQLTLEGDSGAMQRPSGADAGNGYGYYEVTANMSADVQGPAVLLWPGNDVWPGPEIDIVEVINGTPYGTLHWNNNGSDAYTSVFFNGVDETQTHTYGVEWSPGKVEWFVDGQSQGAITDRVPEDYAHGGMNETLSVMNRGWEGGWLTVQNVSYTSHDYGW